MSRNPILDELHAAREKLLADAGGDFTDTSRSETESPGLGPSDRSADARGKPIRRSGRSRAFPQSTGNRRRPVKARRIPTPTSRLLTSLCTPDQP